MAGGKRRVGKTQNARIRQKARRPAKRTKKLVLRNRSALKLVMSGVAPQQSYGHQANGLSWSQKVAMRFNLKTATQFGGTSACTATVLAWLFGPVADPLVKQAAEQLDMWIMTWAELDPQERRETRRTWAIALGEIFAGQKLTRPRGPVEATIGTLMQLGWKPGAPDHWTFNAKESIRLDGKAHTRFIVTARAL